MILEKLEVTPRPSRNFNGRVFRESERDRVDVRDRGRYVIRRCNGEERDRERKRERWRKRSREE